MSKRILCLLLLLSVSVACFACGGNEISETQSDMPYSEAESTGEPEEPSAISEIELSEASDIPVSEEPKEDSTESPTPSEEPVSSEEPISEPSKEPSEISETSSPASDEKPHTVNGFLVYQGRAMEQFGGSSKSGILTAEVMNAFKEKVGDSVNVYAMPVPLACTFYSPAGYERNYANMKDCFYGLRDALVGVGFVDTIAALEPHADELIYARTDHHWFARGAYYAAQALCNVAGADFDTLDTFAEYSFDGFLGSCYSSYKVTELKKYPETFYWYEPGRDYTAHYFDQKFKTEKSSGSMFTSANSYMKFIKGDGYAVRVDSSVQTGRKLLVIKDSFGNALTPFLIAGFEQVYVVDFRAYEGNVLTLINENGITDVAFALSAFSIASSKRDNITRLTKN